MTTTEYGTAPTSPGDLMDLAPVNLPGAIPEVPESDRDGDTGRNNVDQLVDTRPTPTRIYDDESPLVIGDDGDDNPEWVRSKPNGVGTSDNDASFDADKIDPAKFNISDPVSINQPAKLRVDGNGDPVRAIASLAPNDMLDSGHGYLVRDLGEARKTEWQRDCEVCGDAIPPPPAGEWVCQYREDRPASVICNCNWCLHYQMWLRGEYRPNGGRPAKRCGTAECKKKAARERKRRQRDRERTES